MRKIWWHFLKEAMKNVDLYQEDAQVINEWWGKVGQQLADPGLTEKRLTEWCICVCVYSDFRKRVVFVV